MLRSLDTPRTQLVSARIVALLTTAPATTTTIATTLHMHVNHAKDYVKLMRQAGLIHIGAWHRPATGRAVALYAAGNKPDKPKPKALNQQQIQKRYRKRMLDERPEEYEQRLARRRTARIKVQPDPAAAWLYGEAA